METFAIRNLSFIYPKQTMKAIDDLTLKINQGEFMILCGPSGCGKSTLLRQLKSVLTPYGTRAGEIYFKGIPLAKIGSKEQSRAIGFVMQSPENQIVTDKVWHELAFGLESLGYDTPAIRRRVSETASFFGIESWFYKDVTELSGGQKQMLNLASIMVMQPEVLILDEPTSQLDPIAASDFLSVVGKINRELGTTVILTEHRLEEAFPLASYVAVMDKGKIITEGSPKEAAIALKNTGHGMFLGMPSPMRIWSAVENKAPCPITVGDGRKWLTAYAGENPIKEIAFPSPPKPLEKVSIFAEDLWFKYEKGLPDVIKGLSLKVHQGEFMTLLGGNATGKTTCLKLLGKLNKPYRGTVNISGKIGMLPQNPQALFIKKTVREDLEEVIDIENTTEEERERKISHIVSLCRLEGLLDRHPYDFSGGEQQRAALGKVLLLEPDILLLDEPTKGLDAEFKQVFAGIINSLIQKSMTVLMVSHDIEFCGKYAHRCALFFDGDIVTEGTPREFFSGNSFYTTSANRMARSIIPNAITAEDVIIACGGEIPSEPELPEQKKPLPKPSKADSKKELKKRPLWQKIIGSISALGVLFSLIQVIRGNDAASFNESHIKIAALLIGGLFGLILSIGRPADASFDVQRPKEKGKLSKGTRGAVFIILLLIPLTLFAGAYYFDHKKYYLIGLLVLLECMAPFFLIFEGRKPQARELVLIAVLCALGVAGRAAFFMLPQFKPVMALVIISGIALGSETGFLIGAMTVLISNIIMGQGPWTPWQMFSMGIIGFLSGVIFSRRVLRRNKVSLCTFGALSAIIIYGGIMNFASAVMVSKDLNLNIILTYYASGFPMDCIQAAATVFFLWLAAEPMLEKLDRIKIKYGFAEDRK